MTRKGILVSVALLFVALVFVTPGKLVANDELAITELYGQAVHAYFEGQYEESHKFLTDAIDLGTDDPRVYYFRGLSKMKLGRAEEAQKDFDEGGKLEATGPAQFYPIGRSLERIQGSERMTIEKVRKQARIAIRLRRKKIEEARIEAFKRDERLRNAGPKVQLGNPAADSSSDEDPFGSAGNAPANDTPPANATKPAGNAPAGNDPFAAPKKATEPAADDDPFSAPKKAADPAGNDDPFGAPKKAADPAGSDDPFAAPKKAAEPAGDDPFGAPKKAADPAGGDDPFAAPKKGAAPQNAKPANNPDPFAEK